MRLLPPVRLQPCCPLNIIIITYNRLMHVAAKFNIVPQESSHPLSSVTQERIVHTAEWWTTRLTYNIRIQQTGVWGWHAALWDALSMRHAAHVRMPLCEIIMPCGFGTGADNRDRQQGPSDITWVSEISAPSSIFTFSEYQGCFVCLFALICILYTTYIAYF